MRCGFGLCRRRAEHEVVVSDEDDVVLEVVPVCGLHVTPVVAWGRPEPVDALVLRLTG